MMKKFLIMLFFLFIFLSKGAVADGTTTTTIETSTTTTLVQTTSTTTTTTTTETTTTSTTTSTIEETTTTSTSTTLIFPDFEVLNLRWDPINPYPRENLTVYANITNSGEANETGNITLEWFENSNEYSQTIDGLSVDESREVSYTFSSFSGQSSMGIRVDPDNLIQEESESNNNYSKTISTDLNITVLNLYYNGINYASGMPVVDYNTNLTLKISVKYWNNDTTVANLNLDNFKVYDKWTSSGDFNLTSGKLYRHDFSLESSGIYMINYTVPNITNEIIEYGEHEFKLEVNKYNYSTESTTLKYFLDGPYLVFSFPGFKDVDLQGSSSKTVKFDINVTNTGNKTITGLNLITNEIQATYGEFTSLGNCASNEEISPGEQVRLCRDVVLEVRLVRASRLTATVRGNYSSNTIKYQGRSRIDIVNTSSAAEKKETEKDPEFDSGKPEKKSGGGASLQTQQEKYLSIQSFPEKVEVEQGNQSIKSFSVKNENDFEFQDVTLKVIGIDPSWITIAPVGPAEIEPLKTKEYTIAFSIPNETEIKDYSGEIQASSSFETKKQTFTLSIMPGPEFQQNINSMIEDYQSQIAALENEITGKKNKGYNTTEAEQRLEELKTEFNKLLAYKEGGNYKSVYELLPQTETLLNQTKSVVSGLIVLPTQLFTTPESKWVFSGLVGVLVISGVYTFWGRHFNVKEKILRRVKEKKGKKLDLRKKELDTISKHLTSVYEPIKLKPKEKIKQVPKQEISERMTELEKIKSLAVGK